MVQLNSVPLTADAFAPFGEVVELSTATQYPINNGLTTRFHDLLTIDANTEGGRPIVNVFRTDPLPMPHKVEVMERHPLGSQAFLPMQDTPFLVLVGSPGEQLRGNDLTLFRTNGRQGVNLHRNTWHHFQIVLGHTQDFIVIDRGGRGENLEEVKVQDEVWINGLPD